MLNFVKLLCTPPLKPLRLCTIFNPILKSLTLASFGLWTLNKITKIMFVSFLSIYYLQVYLIIKTKKVHFVLGL